mmetsp:Transcript_40713/g.86739  ORF Transcript_40713/g.86739 Transcript_40713/m.86739 type:complete len:279 (-) Transcript_40713:1146-1982(-)
MDVDVDFSTNTMHLLSASCASFSASRRSSDFLLASPSSIMLAASARSSRSCLFSLSSSICRLSSASSSTDTSFSMLSFAFSWFCRNELSAFRIVLVTSCSWSCSLSRSTSASLSGVPPATPPTALPPPPAPPALQPLFFFFLSVPSIPWMRCSSTSRRSSSSAPSRAFVGDANRFGAAPASGADESDGLSSPFVASDSAFISAASNARLGSSSPSPVALSLGFLVLLAPAFKMSDSRLAIADTRTCVSSWSSSSSEQSGRAALGVLFACCRCCCWDGC